MEVISYKKTTARKTHRCCYCDRTIRIGEKYATQFCTDGGTPWTWKYCVCCEKAIDKYDLHKDNWGEGLGSDAFRESIKCLFKARFPDLPINYYKTFDRVIRLLED